MDTGKRLGAAIDGELAIDMFEVDFDSCDGQVELLRDRAIGLASGERPQHVQFALGKTVRPALRTED